MKRKLINLLIVTALVVSAGQVQPLATNRMSPKSLPSPMPRKFSACRSETPVKAANQNGTGGYYESEWSYHAIEVAIRGSHFRRSLCGAIDAPPHLTQDNVFHAARRWQQIDSYRRSWR